MSLNHWPPLTALQVSKLMTFEKGCKEWRYHINKPEADKTMADKQAEGVAYLWNLLGTENLAILADEVGMGKTFQAIALILHLWEIKPTAKVLVITPNKNICEHWRNEFNSFNTYHYHSQNTEIRLPRAESNLSKLVDSIDGSSENIFFTTVHSFSGLTKGYQGDKAVEATRVGALLNCDVRANLEGDLFDLVVVDEAHYFRTINGGSQKVAAAKAFFGSEKNKLAKKVLLMSATPTHSSPADVYNILSYFCPENVLNNDNKKRDAKSLLNQFALRRFRLMQGKGTSHYSKYDYRDESHLPVTFEGNPEAELFFGLYQRKLVQRLKEDRKNSNANKQYLYGYLEGFESFGEFDDDLLNEDLDEGDPEKVKDSFSKASDSEMLHKLSKQYFKCLKKYPEHPKYNALVDQLTPSELNAETLDDIKHLVFVRRIPSVRELTKRTNSSYDDLLAPKIAKAMGWKIKRIKKWKESGWSRELFNEWQRAGSDLDEVQNEFSKQEHDDQKLTSRVANLFVVKKGEKNTLCTNVALRFKKSESIFSYFLEPGSDHLRAEYHYYFEHESGGKVRSLYSTAAFQERMKADLQQSSQFTQQKLKFKLKTVWYYIIPLLSKSNRLKLQSWDKEVIENFANYLKAGVLFASPVIVELFIWYVGFLKALKTKASNNGKLKLSAEQRYKQFLTYVRPKLEESWLLWYFNTAISTFEQVCEKIEGVEYNDFTYKWSALKTLTSPAAFASGHSGNRKRLITGFNSPFYPNVLVATSVFQEGVNLHLQCNSVHHYGIAGNPGDNEQRVGRLDRLFGKVNRALQKESSVNLNISYPYLENSFDEDQLASFLERKFVAEEKLDACLDILTNNEIDGKKAQNWQDFLKKPDKDRREVNDPYPPKFNKDRD